MAQPQHSLICQRSYMIWEREGRPVGRDWEHWFRAEREIQQEQEPRPAARRGTGRAVKAKRKA